MSKNVSLKELLREIGDILTRYKHYKDKVFEDVPLTDTKRMAGAYCNCARWLEIEWERAVPKFEAFVAGLRTLRNFLQKEVDEPTKFEWQIQRKQAFKEILEKLNVALEEGAKKK